MKRLLLIAYYFPPQPEAAAQRPGYLAHHLADYGWETTVIARAFPNGSSVDPRIVPAGAIHRRGLRVSGGAVVPRPKPRVVRLAAGVVRSVAYFPDASIWWVPAAVRAALQQARRHHFDAVITSHSPKGAHLVGAIVSRFTGIPWIADYQDLWSGNPWVKHSYIRTAVERVIEKTAIRRATAITTVDRSYARVLETLHRNVKGPTRNIRVIPHAFDAESWAGIPEVDPIEFRLCYAGRAYGSPDTLFSAIAGLRADGDPAGLAATVHYYGPDSNVFMRSAAASGLTDVVFVHGWQERATVLRAQREAAVLLSLLSPEANETIAGITPSKLFEYLGARRPILAVGPPASVVEEFLTGTGLGYYASNISACKLVLQRAHQNFVKQLFQPPAVSASGPPSPADVARQFADLLNSVA